MRNQSDFTRESTVFLVRHGQTPLNAQGRFRGRLDPPLDERGVEQARAAAQIVAAAPPARVYASPLRRTMETAGFIAEACGLTVAQVPGLIDLDYGSWEGLTWEEAEQADPDAISTFRSDPLTAVPPGGEPVANLAERVMATVIDLAARSSERSATVAVSHDLPIRTFLTAVMGLSGNDLWLLEVAPGSVVRVEAGPAGFHVADPPRLCTE